MRARGIGSTTTASASSNTTPNVAPQRNTRNIALQATSWVVAGLGALDGAMAILNNGSHFAASNGGILKTLAKATAVNVLVVGTLMGAATLGRELGD